MKAVGNCQIIRMLGNRVELRILSALEPFTVLALERKDGVLDVKVGDRRTLRSVSISTHFHAHVSQISRETGIERDRIYIETLLLACEIDPPAGGDPYPYLIAPQRARVTLPSGTVLHVPADVLIPKRTSYRTNKEMITAVEAAHYFAVTKCDPVVVLNERPEEWTESGRE